MSDNTEEKLLRVTSGGNPKNLASAIAHALYESPEVTLRAVGASALNQAVKGIIIARSYVAPRGMDLYVVPGFVTIESRDGDISAIVLKVRVS